MNIDGFKFKCIGSTRFIGANEIPHWEFLFKAAEQNPESLSDDDKEFLKTTDGILKVNTLNPKFFTVGNDYFFGVSDQDNFKPAPKAKTKIDENDIVTGKGK